MTSVKTRKKNTKNKVLDLGRYGTLNIDNRKTISKTQWKGDNYQ